MNHDSFEKYYLKILVGDVSDNDAWTLQESQSVSDVAAVLSKALQILLLRLCRSQLDSYGKRYIVQEIVKHSEELQVKYPLAKNARYLYTTVKTLDNFLDEELGNIVKNTAEDIINKALAFDPLDKNELF